MAHNIYQVISAGCPCWAIAWIIYIKPIFRVIDIYKTIICILQVFIIKALADISIRCFVFVMNYDFCTRLINCIIIIVIAVVICMFIFIAYSDVADVFNWSNWVFININFERNIYIVYSERTLNIIVRFKMIFVLRSRKVQLMIKMISVAVNKAEIIFIIFVCFGVFAGICNRCFAFFGYSKCVAFRIYYIPKIVMVICFTIIISSNVAVITLG